MIKQDDVQRVTDYMKQTLSAQRWSHAEYVAKEASRLSEFYPVDRSDVHAAALFHDIARELDESMILSFAKKFRLEIIAGLSSYIHRCFENWELNNARILHGEAGAWLLYSLFGIQQPAILEAVALHSLGHPKMNDLSAVLYCADFLEESRQFDNRQLRERVGTISLNQLVKEISQSSLKFHYKRGDICFQPQFDLADLSRSDLESKEF